MGLNYISIIGEALGNPEKRHTVEGFPVASFNLSVSSSADELTGSLKITASKKLADKCIDEIHIGDEVLVEGKLYSKIIENRTGQKQKIPYISATNMVVIRKKASYYENYHLQDSEHGNMPEDDEIPF